MGEVCRRKVLGKEGKIKDLGGSGNWLKGKVTYLKGLERQGLGGIV